MPVESYALATAKVQYDLVGIRMFVKKLFNNSFYRIHAEPITTIDQRRPSLRLFDEVSKEMRFLQVESFDTSLRYNAAVIGLNISQHDEGGQE